MVKNEFYTVFGIKNLNKDSEPEQFYREGRKLCKTFGLSESTFYKKSSHSNWFIIHRTFLIRKILINN